MTKPREKTREELTAEIEENKKKIRQFENREKIIKQKLSVEERKASDGGHVEANREQSRLQVFFEDKPDADARKQLKEHGFRWAPSVGAWQRLLNGNAYYAADRIPSIQPLTGEKPTELQRSSIREQQAQMAQAQTEPEEYVYRVHAATRSDSPENLYLSSFHGTHKNRIAGRPQGRYNGKK